MAHKIGHGVSGTTTNSQGYGQNGSLRNILSITSGSADSADKAMAFANQFAPLAPKADPWEAAFQFFAEMGRQASVPGSTALGAAVGSLQAPMDYLTAKKKELRDSEAARTQMALTVGAALKPGAGKGLGAYSEYLLKSPEAIKAYEDAGFTLTQEQRDGTDPVQANSELVSLAPTGFLKYTPSDGSDAGAPGMKADETGVMRYTGYNLPDGKQAGDRVYAKSILEGFTENENKLATTLRKDLTAALKEFIDIDSSMKKY